MQLCISEYNIHDLVIQYSMILVLNRKTGVFASLFLTSVFALAWKDNYTGLYSEYLFNDASPDRKLQLGKSLNVYYILPLPVFWEVPVEAARDFLSIKAIPLTVLEL